MIGSGYVAGHHRRHRGGSEVQLLFEQHARQDNFGGIGIHDIPFARLKAGNEAERALSPADLVPGQPETVGVSQRRFTFVVTEVFSGKHELLLWLDRLRFVIGIKHIDGQSTINFDGFFRIFSEEIKSPANTSYSRVPRLIHDRIGPHRRHRFGADRFVSVKPLARVFAHIQLAAAEQDGAQQCCESKRKIPTVVLPLHCSFLTVAAKGTQ